MRSIRSISKTKIKLNLNNSLLVNYLSNVVNAGLVQDALVVGQGSLVVRLKIKLMNKKRNVFLLNLMRY